MLSPLSGFPCERDRVDPHNPVDEWHGVREPDKTAYVASGEFLRACVAAPLEPDLAIELLAAMSHPRRGVTLALGLDDEPEFFDLGYHPWTTGRYLCLRIDRALLATATPGHFSRAGKIKYEL